MKTRYEAAADGSEALFRFVPESEAERLLLVRLVSDFSVLTARSLYGNRILLEARIVRRGEFDGNASATHGG